MSHGIGKYKLLKLYIFYKGDNEFFSFAHVIASRSVLYGKCLKIVQLNFEQKLMRLQQIKVNIESLSDAFNFRWKLKWWCNYLWVVTYDIFSMLHEVCKIYITNTCIHYIEIFEITFAISMPVLFIQQNAIACHQKIVQRIVVNLI